MSAPAGDERFTAATRHWIQHLVVVYNLCPFAWRELEAGSVRFQVTGASDEEQLLLALVEELEYLQSNPDTETTLLIHPQVLRDFLEYNRFLSLCEELLVQLGLEGVFQVASFHPDYQFAGTQPEDPENYSNRSPFPMLHLLREDSVARAVAHHPDAEGIPTRNIALLNELGAEQLQAILEGCFEAAS